MAHKRIGGRGVRIMTKEMTKEVEGNDCDICAYHRR